MVGKIVDEVDCLKYVARGVGGVAVGGLLLGVLGVVEVSGGRSACEWGAVV